MAIITEESEPPTQHPKPMKFETTSPPSASPKSVDASRNPFHFWFFFTLFISLIILLCSILSSLTPQDAKTWFLSLPPNLRRHYSSGSIIKVQTTPNYPQIELFSIQEGLVSSDSHVLIVHGVGCSSFAFHEVVKSLGLKSVHTVAVDLPGSGFSDKSVAVIEENVGSNGVFGRLWEVYEEIKEKGLFWGFDQLVEQGYVNFEENRVHVLKKERIKPIELGSDEMSRVLGQVVDSVGLAPVDLVLHDSALGLCANWVSENRGLVRSIVVLDGVPSGTAFPLWTLEMPWVSQLLLGSRFAFERVLALCCVKSVDALELEAHRLLLKGTDGGRAVVGMGKKLNLSFDLSEWSRLDAIKELPILMIWSRGWSEAWMKVGHDTIDSIPQAKLVPHSGGRWTQGQYAEEVAERIYEFVTSLPKSKKQVEEMIPENSFKVFQESSSDPFHHHGHSGNMDNAYGPEQVWST